MLYKFRWLIAGVIVLVIIVVGVIIDIIPRYRALAVARQERAALSAKVAALPAQAPLLLSRENNQKISLSAISKLAIENGVTINNLSEATSTHLHLSVRGNYGNMWQFIFALLTKFNVMFSSFTYQAIGNNEVRFVADVVLSYSSTTIPQRFIDPRNPFCNQAGGNANFSMQVEKNGFSLDLQNTNLSDTIRLLAKQIGQNVIVSPAVEGNVTLHLKQAHPSTVFDLLLDSYGLEKLQRANVWYIAPREELIKRKQQEMKWQHLSSQTATLQTETWQIRYAKAQDIAHLLQEGKSTFLSERGQVRVDMRTNILCVQDIPERMIAIRKLVATLDQPSRQVRIEARLASVDNDFERELGVDFSVQAKGASAVPGHYSVAVARLPDGTELDVKLAALESKGHAELISSPSLYTTNQQSAAIEAGEEVPYQEVSESGGTAVVFKKAVLSLKVTPQVLPGGYVLLQLHINQDRPSSRIVLGMPTINTRQILTSVLVKSGETAVLGGIYENQDENAVRRIPLLGSVPVLGELFTVRATRLAKRELLIFVTPKIMTSTS